MKNPRNTRKPTTRKNPRAPTQRDLKLHPRASVSVLSYIAPRVRAALIAASRNLTQLGVRHAICGGVAVGAYGHIRATKDVDFLVGDEAFVVKNGLESFAPGVTWAVDGIPTDMIRLDSAHDDDEQRAHHDMRFLEKEIADPFYIVTSEGTPLPLLSPEALITMKLVAHRRKDLDDVRSIIENASTDKATMRRYLLAHGRMDLMPHLERALTEDT